MKRQPDRPIRRRMRRRSPRYSSRNSPERRARISTDWCSRKLSSCNVGRWWSGKKSARSDTASAPIHCCHPTVASPLFVGQSKHGQRPAERGIGRQTCIATDGAEARRIDRLVFGRQLALIDRAMPGGGVFRLKQTSRQADAGPTADAGQHGNVLLAAVFVRHDVADDAGRGFELVEFLPGLGIDRLPIAFKRTVEDDVAGGCQRAAPPGGVLFFWPPGLSGLALPGDGGGPVCVALG